MPSQHKHWGGIKPDTFGPETTNSDPRDKFKIPPLPGSNPRPLPLRHRDRRMFSICKRVIFTMYIFYHNVMRSEVYFLLEPSFLYVCYDS